MIFLPPRAPGDSRVVSATRWGEWVDCGQGDVRRNLAQRSRPFGTHAERPVAAGRRSEGQKTLQAVAARLRRCRFAASGMPLLGPGCHGARRCLLPDDHAGVGRLLAGGRRASFFTPPCSGPWPRERSVLGNTRNLIAGRPPAGIPQSWQRLAGDERRFLDRIPVLPRRLPGGRPVAGRQSCRRRGPGGGVGRRARGRAIPRAGLRPRGRSAREAPGHWCRRYGGYSCRR